MIRRKQRTVRKGRIYLLKVDDKDYRAFIWEVGATFCGRVEDYPQVEPCRGRTVVAVRTLLGAALSTSLAAPPDGAPLTPLG